MALRERVDTGLRGRRLCRCFAACSDTLSPEVPSAESEAMEGPQHRGAPETDG